MRNIELVEELRSIFTTLRECDYEQLDEACLKAKLYVKKIFGKDSEYLDMIASVSFSPMIYIDDDYTNNLNSLEAWRSGISSMKNIIKTMKTELELQENTTNNDNPKILGQDIFIVHGHDETMKLEVARTLEHMGIKPVILHEQADKGRSIMEKLVDESQRAGFAVILLSPDDCGYSCQADESERKTRARQNVILELGYFIGKLGKDRVMTLYKEDCNFEFPTDVAGILYKKYEPNGVWRFELGRELNAAGYQIDLNKLL